MTRLPNRPPGKASVTAGIVDIHTKSGAFEPGGEAGVYGGSYDTVKPNFDLGGSKGSLNYFVDGSYTHDNLGLENPTASADPIHDTTDQLRTFTYLSYVLDIQKQNAALKELAGQRDEFINKFDDSAKDRNAVVAKYNDLVRQVETNQAASAKP